MSSEETPEETPSTDGGKSKLPNDVVRPPDPLRDTKNDPTRPGFREKSNKGSKAQKGKRKKK